MSVDNIIAIWIALAKTLLVLSVIFFLIEKIKPCNRHIRYWRGGMLTDTLYAFINPILNRLMATILLTLGASLVFYGESEQAISGYLAYGYGPIGGLPIWLQAALMMFAADLMLYWLHRLFHTRHLWPFHAIHHSSEELSWLSTFRFHPINSWGQFVLVDCVLILLGFSPAAIVTLGLVNMFYSGLVHANVDWDFGPFKSLLASPIFHRWHHTTQAEGLDKNFAPTFPFLDIWFGTYYMPDNKRPERYGVDGANIPKDYVGQLIWPFIKNKH